METDRDLNVIVESHIPFVKGALEPFADVRYLPPEQITPEAVADADALIVRTRTRCDEALLGGSRCRFVATATIGTDHIDQDWCKARGIEVANAPGCNAPAVAQYVLASINALADRPLDQYTLGIIGVGHVGSIVERWARHLGMRVLVNDPPRRAAEGGDGWSTLDDIARQADIITVHTPLDASTYHLVDDGFLARCGRNPIIINAARGPIVDNAALIEALGSGRVSHAVIDCWEGEPAVMPGLLAAASVATPHIAGYSYEGKVRATRMALDALSRYFALPTLAMTVDTPADAPATVSIEAIAASYDPLADTAAFRADPGAFERLRNTYTLRHEP